MTAACPCSDSNHSRQTVLMALITALKAVFSGCSSRFGASFCCLHARTSFSPVHSRSCMCECANKASGKARQNVQPGVCSEGRISRLQVCCRAAFVCITEEMRSNIRRALLYGINFCEVLNSNTPRLCCGGNGVAEGDSEE